MKNFLLHFKGVIVGAMAALILAAVPVLAVGGPAGTPPTGNVDANFNSVTAGKLTVDTKIQHKGFEVDANGTITNPTVAPLGGGGGLSPGELSFNFGKLTLYDADGISLETAGKPVLIRDGNIRARQIQAEGFGRIYTKLGGEVPLDENGAVCPGCNDYKVLSVNCDEETHRRLSCSFQTSDNDIVQADQASLPDRCSIWVKNLSKIKVKATPVITCFNPNGVW